MADRTNIEWTDATWNPVRGCARVSQGCRHCYAERVAARFSGEGQPYAGLIHPKTKGWNGTVKLVPEALSIPWRWTRPRRIFVNSMSDLFHPDVPFEFIAAVFWIMSVTTRHTYQILTKRPERMLEFFNWLLDHGTEEDDRNTGLFAFEHEYARMHMSNAVSDVGGEHPVIAALPWEPSTSTRGGYDNCGPGWPFGNVWLGVSVEDQATANERIPLLLQCPAAVRWISAEPLLGPIDLTDIDDGAAHREIPREHWSELDDDDSPPAMGINALSGLRWLRFGDWSEVGTQLDWVVVGGESGPEARPMNPQWARELRDQCEEASVPFLFKQWGDWVSVSEVEGDGPGFTFPDGRSVRRIGKKAAGRTLDGVLHDAYPEAA